jgi:hypothetical protein
MERSRRPYSIYKRTIKKEEERVLLLRPIPR